MKHAVFSLAILCLFILFFTPSCTSTGTTPAYTPPATGTVSVASPAATPEATPVALPTETANNQNSKGLTKVPKVEVVFVLDTTGSMAGLLNGAKQKIWSIANAILQAQPKPVIQMGLIAYRDQGDDYVTKVYGLSDNMDKVYENLSSFQAGGGGDTPEHVNKALADALHNIQWSKGKNVMRVVFLVGDAPPHNDYQDGFNYKKLCEEARQRDIVINTIRCGNDRETEQYWREIASKGAGQYASIEQTGGVVATTDTPFDGELATLNSEMGTTLLPYGSASERESVITYQRKSEAMAPAVQAERAKFSAGSHYVAKKDLVDAINNKEVKLEELDGAELPEPLQKLDRAKQQEYLKNQAVKRDDLKKKIADISKKRETYIKEKQGEKKDSFDNQVLSFIRDQAKTKGLTIK